MEKDAFSANRTRELYERLCRLVADRAPAEEEIPSRRDAESEKESAQYGSPNRSRSSDHDHENHINNNMK